MAEDLHSTSTTPPWDYPWDEWFEAMADAGAPSNDPAKVTAWFARQYPDPSEAHWKQQRYEAAYSYLQRHRGSFAEFEVVSTRPDGSSGAMILSYLYVALWQWFSEVSEHALLLDAPMDIILQWARENAAEKG